MRLPLARKQKTKKDQTLDTVASVAKAWGEWQLAKGAAKAAKRAPWKIIGGLAAVFAAGGLAAKKLVGRGGSSSGEAATAPATPAYTGPVADPNAPGAQGKETTGASPSGPVAPTSATPDPKAPDADG